MARNYPSITLPNVKQNIGVIYRAQGRRVDILRRVWWNLEQIHGRSVYTYDTFFWQKVGCLLDNVTSMKRAANKGNLMLLSSSISIPEGTGSDRLKLQSIQNVFHE